MIVLKNDKYWVASQSFVSGILNMEYNLTDDKKTDGKCSLRSEVKIISMFNDDIDAKKYKGLAMRGGKRSRAGRKSGSTGKELKKSYTIRAYPSDVVALKKKDKTLQKAVDHGIKILLGR